MKKIMILSFIFAGVLTDFGIVSSMNLMNQRNEAICNCCMPFESCGENHEVTSLLHASLYSQRLVAPAFNFDVVLARPCPVCPGKALSGRHTDSVSHKVNLRNDALRNNKSLEDDCKPKGPEKCEICPGRPIKCSRHCQSQKHQENQAKFGKTLNKQ